MRSCLSFLVLAAGFCGCTTAPHFEVATNALRTGDYARAERHYYMAIREGDQVGLCWLGLGNVFSHQKREFEARNAWQVAARLGEPAAQSALAAIGLPVPEADLIVAETGDSIETIDASTQMSGASTERSGQSVVDGR